MRLRDADGMDRGGGGAGMSASDSRPIAKIESKGLTKDWRSDMKERQEPKVTPRLVAWATGSVAGASDQARKPGRGAGLGRG